METFLVQIVQPFRNVSSCLLPQQSLDFSTTKFQIWSFLVVLGTRTWPDKYCLQCPQIRVSIQCCPQILNRRARPLAKQHSHVFSRRRDTLWHLQRGERGDGKHLIYRFADNSSSSISFTFNLQFSIQFTDFLTTSIAENFLLRKSLLYHSGWKIESQILQIPFIEFQFHKQILPKNVTQW